MLSLARHCLGQRRRLPVVVGGGDGGHSNLMNHCCRHTRIILSSSSSQLFHTSPSPSLSSSSSPSPTPNNTPPPPSSQVVANPQMYENMYQGLVQEWAMKPQTGVRFKDMIARGQTVSPDTMLEDAQRLYRELPIRFARRAKELENLPYQLSDKEPIRQVQQLYVQSFVDVISRPMPQTPEEEQAFTDLLVHLLQRHKNIVMMAKGIMMLKRDVDFDVLSCPFLQDFLDRFYMARLGLKVLMQQHVALHTPQPGFIGAIGLNVSPLQVAEDAAADCSLMCERAFGRCPEVRYLGSVDLEMQYIPDHLHYMLLELLKNSMRAVCEYHKDEDELPPIDVVFADGKTDIVIKVGDQGGGIARSDYDKIWTYLYTTAQAPDLEEIDIPTGWTPTSIMAGLGYGLPLCRLFARYFGGDVVLESIEGYGTDCFVYINKLGDSDEVLPQIN